MSRRWFIGILFLWSLIALFPLGLQADGPSDTRRVKRAEALESASPATSTDRLSTAPHIRHERAAPQKARDLLAQIQARQENPLPGYIEGREFKNREPRLSTGHYREYI